MKTLFFFASILVLLNSCGSYFSREELTEIPRKQQSFRTGILRYLDDQIEKHPDQVDLYIEKARYYKEDGWPNDALPILNQAIELDSTNLEAVKLRESYFLSKGRYKDALRDIGFLEEKGLESPELKNDKITALYGQQNFDDFFREAAGFSANLNRINKQHFSDYFLSQGDSLMAIRFAYLNFLERSLDKEKTLRLVNLLLEQGFTQKSFNILGDEDSDDADFNLTKADILMKLGERKRGVSTILRFAEKGSLKALLKLNEYYLSEKKLDSAIYQNDQFLQRYDSSLVILKKQAFLYQNKFLWAKSLDYLNIIVKKDPSDKEALKDVSKVSGKIAYLRSLRNKRDSIPKINTIKP